MDPVSQGVYGALAAQNSATNRQHLGLAGLLGWLSGMAPDLDVLFRSASDPLLALEYHRQFTHALIFIPIGGLICALFFYFLIAKRKQIPFKLVLLWCTLGYATHGFLDACTTYGTQLLWPFSDMRVAWNTVSIIDPLLTVPLLILFGVTLILCQKRYALAALCWIVLYSGLGVLQRERVEKIGYQLAQSRDHQPERLEAKPSFANILVWKVVYSANDQYYVDAVKAGITPIVFEGSSVPKLNVQRDFPWLEMSTQQAIDIERFRWFSNDYLAISPQHPGRIIDIRYSALPNEIRGLWGIELDPQANPKAHVTKVFDRDPSREKFGELWNMLKAGGL